MTLYEAYYGKKPIISLYGFFVLMHVHMHKDERTKLNFKCKKCIFVRCSEESKTYCLFNSIKRWILINKDVVFEETKPKPAKEVYELPTTPNPS